MSRVAILGVFALAFIALTGHSWAQGNAPQYTVTGTVAYREPVALPADAAIDVRLEDTSLQDATAKLIGESVFAAAGQQVPISFQVSFSPADINPAHTYQLRANITVNGKMTFTSTTAYPVITHGAPMQANIMLQQVQAPAPTNSAGPKLHGTYWMLVELNGKPAVPGMGKDAAIHQVAPGAGQSRGFERLQRRGRDVHRGAECAAVHSRRHDHDDVSAGIDGAGAGFDQRTESHVKLQDRG